MVSATFTQDVLAVASKIQRSAVEILLPVEEVPLDGIKQFHVDCEHNDLKFDVLCDLFEVGH
jgi:ATP-dependent RNA helicase